jgi:hypothetical protein
MMKTNLLLALSSMLLASTAMAQNIDFDLPGKTTPGKDTELNYISWAVPRATSDTKTFDNGVTITISAGGAASAVGSNWNKTDVETNGLRVIADEVLATNLVDGNLTPITDASTSLILTITGLTPGQHSLKAYHNNSDKNQVQPDIDISVDGTVVATGQKFTSAAQSTLEAGTSFITFNVTEGQPVVITYTTKLEAGVAYTNTRMMLNGLEFDAVAMVATDPQPENHDFHAGTEDGTIHFSWLAAPGAVSHKLVFGTDSTQVATSDTYEYEGTATEYVKTDLYALQQYWWRVDEVDSDGNVHRGKAWTCKPCHLAFPKAEGYGRYAIGGRGGQVYHVTNLSGSKDVEGSLLYGLVTMKGPRYIVFDVSGIIELDFESYFTQPYATIAGQTAPGKGICIKSSNINIGSDVIARHVRFKRGLGVYGENTGNAMGMSGADHAIVDHCTAAWGTDETVSGRGAQNISFQYSVISEALGIAGHKNYEDGKNHGFAATIDGRIGSWHHNLLVNCNGRNWSMGGGMDGQNRPIGGLDIFNNVCYNWNGRTTDGNCHAVNFVNNYYKMGADTKRTELFIMQFELPTDVADNRTNTGYVSGNIRENKNHTLSYDKRGDTYTATGYVPTDYEYLVNEPLFPSYAEIHTAKDAMKIVTSYAGVTMPMRDEQHVRNVRETLDGTWTYKGSKSNIKGEIDNEADITDAANGGWEEWPEEHRTADWDTDQDGMPDWWEKTIGSDPNIANHNDDPDHDGWTLLEDYLDFMAHPYVMIQSNGSAMLDLKPYFAGFYGQNKNTVTPTYTVNVLPNGVYTASVDGSQLEVSALQPDAIGIYGIDVTINDGETQWTQRFGITITTDAATAISQQPIANSPRNATLSKRELPIVRREFFTLDGRQVTTMQSHETYIMRTTDAKGHRQSLKIIKN